MIFHQMFNIVNAGIVVIDKCFIVKEWNLWMEIYSKINAEKIIDSSIFDFFPKLDNALFKRNCKSVFAFGNFYFFSQKLHQYLFPFKSDLISGMDLEYMQQNCTLGPLRDDENKISHIYILVQDVTELVATSIKLKKAIVHSQKTAEDARQANRIKTDFIANISHEIRTPMNAILGFTELLQERTNDRKNLEYLSAITSSGKTLLKLINNILDISKIEVGKLELNYKPTNLDWIISELKQTFIKTIREKGLDLVIEIDPATPLGLYLDETRFLQILTNILGNAIKFTDEGYIKLSIRATLSETDKSCLNLEISVEDTGIGIHKDELENIFTPFTQQKKQDSAKYEGTGLGLTITKQLVEMMYGDISVESDVEKGSIFRVTFYNVNIAGDQAGKEAPIAPETDFSLFEQATVLIVDDKKLNRLLIRDFLKDSPFRMIEAENGREAVDLASLYNPDVILMDLKMPVMDGYQAIKILKNDPVLKKIHIIVVTAASIKEDAKKIKDLGCKQILIKPVSKIAMYKALSSIVPFKKGDEDPEERSFIITSHAVKSFTPGQKKNLHKLLEVLNHKMMDRWNRIMDAFFVDEIEVFAKEIESLGEQYKIALLSDWGSKLGSLADAFDMDKLPKILDDYPKLVRSLEEIVRMDTK